MYLSYLYNLLKHKYYVYHAGRQINAPLFRLIIHDWTKLLPSEFLFWVFRQKDVSVHKFDSGWLHHYHVNKHHWQYWVLREDSGVTRCLEMPEKYIREMIADWAGAGKNKTGKWDNVLSWYSTKKDVILLNENTRKRVEELLIIFSNRIDKNGIYKPLFKQDSGISPISDTSLI